MKRLTQEEAEFYIPLVEGDPMLCRKAVAFTLTPVEDEPGWDEVTYYGDPSDNRCGTYDINPLEIMLKEWQQEDSTNK